MLDEDGHPIDIKPYDRNVATKLIEDFMLIANETAWLRIISGREIPLYIEHMTSPDSEKSQKLFHILSIILAIRFILELMRYTQRNSEAFLMKVDGTDEESLISRLTLRSIETGTIYNSMYRTFWTGGKLLLSLYITNPQIS